MTHGTVIVLRCSFLKMAQGTLISFPLMETTDNTISVKDAPVFGKNKTSHLFVK